VVITQKPIFYMISDWMIDQFKQNGVLIKDVCFCPYHPTAAEGDYKKDMPCRKPHPGMLLDAANEYQINLTQSSCLVIALKM